MYADSRSFPMSRDNTDYWINVRDPSYFLEYGILYIYVERILFSS